MYCAFSVIVLSDKSSVDGIKEKYILQLRDDDPNISEPGMWSLFGGGIQPTESAEEAIVRETLLGTLKRQGKNSLIAVYAINSLASVVSAQGRHEEALQLRKAALDILASSNVPSDTQSVGSLKFRIAGIVSSSLTFGKLEIKVFSS